MQKPIKVLFILGAGASAYSGAPLMNNFITKAENLIRLNDANHPIQRFNKEFNDVFELLSESQNLHVKANLNLNNLETLLGALEMGILIGKFGEKSEEQAIELKKSLIKTIVATLDYSMVFPNEIIENKFYFNAPSPYFTLLSNLFQFEKTQKIKSSFITFNYDFALETGLRRLNWDYDLGLTESIKDYSTLLLKLHGSINWFSDKNKKILPLSLPGPFENYSKNFLSSFITIASDKILSNPEELPVIVPPTWYKTEYREQLNIVWKWAGQELSKAEYIFIIGYSIPETDLFFRYLYALGVQSKTIIKKIFVINPDSTVFPIFGKMISNNLHQSYVIQQLLFEKSMDFIVGEMRKILQH